MESNETKIEISISKVKVSFTSETWGQSTWPYQKYFVDQQKNNQHTDKRQRKQQPPPPASTSSTLFSISS